jgi:hypothetical protein
MTRSGPFFHFVIAGLLWLLLASYLRRAPAGVFLTRQPRRRPVYSVGGTGVVDVGGGGAKVSSTCDKRLIMVDRVALKIEQTQASIAALKRQAEGVQRQIEVLKIKLQAYQELQDDSKADEPSKPAAKPKQAQLFVSTVPWDRVFDAIRETVGGKEFGAEDVNAQLAHSKMESPSSTVRTKLQSMADAGTLVRISKGRYKFAPAAKKAAA